MSFRIKLNKSAQANARRIAQEQVNASIGEIDDSNLPVKETVHQVRKRCKKVRGLLRLIRPSLGEKYSTENQWYRDIARSVAGLRDGSVALDTFELVSQKSNDQVTLSSYESIRQELLNLQGEIVEQTDIKQRLTHIKTQLLVGSERLLLWKIKPRGFAGFKEGFKAIYRQAVEAMRSAIDSPAGTEMHEWRKHVKYHWYHCRMLQNIWPAMMKTRRDQLKELSEYLGDANDASVLASLLDNHRDKVENEKDIDNFLSLLEKHHSALSRKAFRLGKKLFAENDKSITKRFGQYWKVTNEKPS